MSTASGAPRWPFVARDTEFQRALAALGGDAEFRGAALIGESGVGKSTLARALGSAVEGRGQTVRYVLGTRAGHDIPLGAFSRAVVVDATQPAAMLAAAHRNLEQQHDLVIVVDDAHLLDPLSATLVHQLATEGTARLIVTLGSGDDAPDPVTTLLKERMLLGLRIEAFTRDQTAELASSVLGGAVESRLVDELHSRTAGNPLLLRGLLSPGRESGVLVHTDEGWRLRGPLCPDRELHDLLVFRLRSLDPAERAVIELLATAEVLDWEILRDLCDPAAVERVERLGMVQLIPDGPALVAQLNHPVIGEVAAELAGVVGIRRLNGVLAQTLQKYLQTIGCRLRSADLRGQIRVAQFQMRSDLPPDLDRILHAAEMALRLGNVAAGETLARFALDHDGGLRAAALLADALRWQGRGGEAEQLLSGFDPDGDDELTARWGYLRVVSLFGGSGQAEAACEVLGTVRDRVGGGPAADLVAATETWFTFYSGDVTRAIELGLPVCTPDAHPLATALAAGPTCWALALAGRFTEVRGVALAGLRSADAGASGPQRLAMGLAEAVALSFAGDVSTAERIVESYADGTAGVPEARAIVDALHGYTQLARGALPSASAALHEAVSVLSKGFQLSALAPALAWLTQVEAMRGAPESAAALRQLEAVFGPQVAVYLPELELAHAWVHAAHGRVSAGRRHAVRAAQIARQAGTHALEMRALHTAARFFDHTHAARLDELSHMLAAPLPDAIAMQARGLAGRDGFLLDAVADRFTDLGTMALAADAAAQAAQAHQRQGKRSDELGSLERALRLAGQCNLRSPAIVAITNPLPITDREREIATMAAAGLSNRQIAESLYVSVRTVSGHLYRIFGKLDIQSRDQLTQLIGSVVELE